MSALSSPAPADPPPAAGPAWGSGAPVPKPTSWLRPSDPAGKAAASPWVLLAALLTGLLTAWLLDGGIGVGLPI